MSFNINYCLSVLDAAEYELRILNGHKATKGKYLTQVRSILLLTKSSATIQLASIKQDEGMHGYKK